MQSTSQNYLNTLRKRAVDKTSIESNIIVQQCYTTECNIRLEFAFKLKYYSKRT